MFFSNPLCYSLTRVLHWLSRIRWASRRPRRVIQARVFVFKTKSIFFHDHLFLEWQDIFRLSFFSSCLSSFFLVTPQQRVTLDLDPILAMFFNTWQSIAIIAISMDCGVWGVQDIKARWHTPPHIQCVSDQNYFGLHAHTTIYWQTTNWTNESDKRTLEIILSEGACQEEESSM